MKIDVSVVVPVYNSEEYLPECIESLIHQTLKTVEFIFVDDGSTDKSLNILEEYQKQDSRIKILKQKNLYAGVARNNGMDIANGKYIIFLDSDDYFHPSMLYSAFNSAEKNGAQIVMFGYSEFDSNNGGKLKKVIHKKFPSGVFSAKLLGTNIFSSVSAVPWNKLLLLSFVKESQIRYQNIKVCNDEYFNRMIVMSANRMVYLKKRYVFYRINNNQSLQGTVKKQTAEGLNSVLSVLTALKKEMINRNMFDQDYRAEFYKHAIKKINIRFSRTVYDNNELYQAYYYLRQKLIPDIFDSDTDFSQDHLLNNVHNSDDFSHFLFLEYSNIMNEYVPKTSHSYRIGQAVLFLPQKMGIKYQI